MPIAKEQIPNLLTLSRIALIPVLALLLYLPFSLAAWLALFLYIIICLTDYLDGWLARRMGAVTPLGTFLDPIADKILVAVMLLIFVHIERLPGFWILPVMIILTREFLIAGLREYLGAKKVQVPVMWIAKWKTAVQMFALAFLIIGDVSRDYLFIGWTLLLAAAAITAYTGYAYIKAAWGHLTGKAGDTVDTPQKTT